MQGAARRNKGEGGGERAERSSERRSRNGTPRWDLYRLLADATRVRLLALASREELGVSELAELLREGQPKVSRHAAALRDAELLRARRHGTWLLLRTVEEWQADPVVADAVSAGLAACQADGTLARVAEVVAARDAATRAFFARGGRPLRVGPPDELAAYLAALGALVWPRELAIDVGSGDGALLEVVAPVFARVIALDRSEAQLELARARAERRGFHNVRFVRGEVDGPEIRRALAAEQQGASAGAVRARAERARPERAHGAAKVRATPGAAHDPLADHAPRSHGADAVFASRVLHHAPLPSRALAAIVELARPATLASRDGAAGPGGAVVVLDYESHHDESLREQQADLWLGFAPDELASLARAAGLETLVTRRLPAAWCGDGPDRHLHWQLLAGRRGVPHPGAPARGEPATSSAHNTVSCACPHAQRALHTGRISKE